jgi:hypothetical protein
MQSPLKEPQFKILKFLFDRGQPARCEEVFQVLASPKSETEYHCDVLREKRMIALVSMPIHMTFVGEGAVEGFEITSGGRKHIMDSK